MHKSGAGRGFSPDVAPSLTMDTEGSGARHTQPLASPFPAKHPNISLEMVLRCPMELPWPGT